MKILERIYKVSGKFLVCSAILPSKFYIKNMGGVRMPSPTKEWARVITSFTELPESFRMSIPADSLIPYMVYSPEDNWGQRKTNEKMTVLYPACITVYEKAKEGIKQQEFFFGNLQYVEQGSILLYSWLTFSGFKDPKNAAATVEYNTVVQELFHPFVEAIRQSFYSLERGQGNLDWGPLDFLRSQDYKYWNYSKEAILPGSNIQKVIYQQQVQEQKWFFMERIITLPHILLQTEGELIIIRDKHVKGKKLRNEARYGAERIYIPLRSVKCIKIIPVLEKEMFQLALELENYSFTLLYSKDKEGTLKDFFN